MLDAFAAFGFPVCAHRRVVNGPDGLIAFHAEIEAMRNSLPYDIDGVVYKGQFARAARAAWLREPGPRWAVAHKYPAQEEITRLTGIEVQVAVPVRSRRWRGSSRCSSAV